MLMSVSYLLQTNKLFCRCLWTCVHAYTLQNKGTAVCLFLMHLPWICTEKLQDSDPRESQHLATRLHCFTSAALLFVQHVSLSSWSFSPTPASSSFCIICILPLDGAVTWIFPKTRTCLVTFTNILKGKIHTKRRWFTLPILKSEFSPIKINTYKYTQLSPHTGKQSTNTWNDVWFICA